MIKRCARCGKEFDGHHSAKYCVDCRPIVKREYSRQWYLKNRERRREYDRQRYREKREYYRQRYIKSKLAVLRGVSK